MSTLKTLVGLLFMPVPLALGVMLLGLVFLLLRRRLVGTGMLVMAPLLVGLASWGPVADSLLHRLERAHPPLLDASGLEDVQAIVVLGSGYYANERLPITSQMTDTSLVRLAEGVRLYRQLQDVPLLVAGGSRDDAPPIADGYVRAARALGVPEDDLLQMDWPVDTAEEAYGTVEMMGEGATVIVVTSASHMRRSIRHFQHVGLNPIPAPTRHKAGMPGEASVAYWIPGSIHLRKTERALYEYMGLIAYRLDHRWR
ncbi:MAG: YdcF family protein [Ectothiorhodospiraceae bacterium]|nr:YdcF family protein [Ectothiorhodospiraceae bacterium]MCH8506052.1 YdcF family protein [Ectothiorhodospiraceae bacterium]